MSSGARVSRLRKHSDFSDTFANGKSVANKLLVLYSYRRAEVDVSRFGYSVSKRVGNAVVRNRIKRRLQGIMREVGPTLKPGHDLVWLVRNPAAKAPFNALTAAALELIERSGLRKRVEL